MNFIKNIMGNFFSKRIINLTNKKSYAVHTKEASYFLSKGIPTSYMSDARPEVVHNDPATTLPKRFAKAMKY